MTSRPPPPEFFKPKYLEMLPPRALALARDEAFGQGKNSEDARKIGQAVADYVAAHGTHPRNVFNRVLEEEFAKTGDMDAARAAARKAGAAAESATAAKNTPPAFSDADYARYRALQNAKDSGAPMNPKLEAELKDLTGRFQASLGGPPPKQASLPAAVPPPPPGPDLPRVVSFPRHLAHAMARHRKELPEISEPPGLRADWATRPNPPEPSPATLPAPPPPPYAGLGLLGRESPSSPIAGGTVQGTSAPERATGSAGLAGSFPEVAPPPYREQSNLGQAAPSPPTIPPGVIAPAPSQTYPELAPQPPPLPTPTPPPYQNVPPPPGGTGAFPKAEFAAPRQNVPPGSVGGSPPPGRNFGGFGDTAYAGAPYKGVDFDLGSIKRPPAFIDSVLNFLAGGRASGLNPAGDSTDSGRGGILAEILAELKAIRELLGGQRGGVASRGSLPSYGASLSDTEGYPTASPSVNESSRTGMRGAGGWGFGSLSPFLGEMAANFLEPRRRDPR